MAWWRRNPPKQALTAAVQVVQGPDLPDSPAPSPQVGQRQLYRTPDEWQREVWDFYDSLGEFRQGVTWKSNMLSRVRLRAAKIVPNEDEPQIIDSGPAHDLVRQLAGGVGGQSTLMSDFGVYLSVPGECYLIGETLPNGKNRWYTRSIEEVRPSVEDPRIMAVREGRGWRTLPNNSYVYRVYRPHRRWHAVADSPARAARPLLRELELVNRHIAAQYLSRLASAGLIALPEEVSFPVRPEFADAPDPFVAEWIEIAAEAIKTPGTASAVVPIPLRMPGELIDKIKHIDFTLKLDDTIISKRDSGLARLAIELDMPPEALLGTRDVNHWNAWLIDEQGVKIHVAPDAEVACAALTEGFLQPMMLAAGEDPTDLVVWYDASELILRPDRSKSAQELYDRVEINGTALRRENGFDESDEPNDDEARVMILKKAALQPVNTFAALDELGYETTHDTPPSAPRPDAEPTPPVEQPDPRTPPNEQPPPDNPTVRSSQLLEQLSRQAGLMHGVKISLDGWSLLHPRECNDHLFSCPVTHATWKPVVAALPGAPGTYRCWLNAHGQPILGDRIYNGDAADMIETSKRGLQHPQPV